MNKDMLDPDNSAPESPTVEGGELRQSLGLALDLSFKEQGERWTSVFRCHSWFLRQFLGRIGQPIFGRRAWCHLLYAKSDLASKGEWRWVGSELGRYTVRRAGNDK
jgi:hypothetical protein